MGEDRTKELKEYIRKELGVKPKNMALYEQAFYHRSYAYEQGLAPHQSNERLEFLGDSVLGLALADYLCARYSTSEEGEISKMKAQLGSRTTLAEVARRLNLADFLRVGRGEDKAGTQNLPSLSSNVFEAVTGAIYLDLGYTEAANFVTRNFAPEFEKDLVSQDYKSVLQEFAQRKFHTAPFYRIVRAFGPEHHKTFEILSMINGRVYGRGRGHTKKEGEQSAARQALRRLGVMQEREPRPYSQGRPYQQGQGQRPEYVPAPARKGFWARLFGRG